MRMNTVCLSELDLIIRSSIGWIQETSRSFFSVLRRLGLAIEI
jgi:hypothetical protein